MEKTSARVLRERRREKVCALLEEVRVSCGATQADCARYAGAKPQHLQNWEDPDHPRNLGLADAMGLPFLVQRGLLRAWADELGLVVSEAPAAEGVQNLLEHLAATIRECSECEATFAAAAADGKLTASEATSLAKEAGEAMERLSAIRELARAALAASKPLEVVR